MINTSVRDTTTLCHNYIKLCHNMVVSLAQFTISLPLELDGWTRIRPVFFTLGSYARYVLGATPSDEPRYVSKVVSYPRASYVVRTLG